MIANYNQYMHEVMFACTANVYTCTYSTRFYNYTTCNYNIIIYIMHDCLEYILYHNINGPWPEHVHCKNSSKLCTSIAKGDILSNNARHACTCADDIYVHCKPKPCDQLSYIYSLHGHLVCNCAKCLCGYIL